MKVTGTRPRHSEPAPSWSGRGDLVAFARRHGYRHDELIDIIEGVSAPVDVPLETR